MLLRSVPTLLAMTGVLRPCISGEKQREIRLYITAISSRAICGAELLPRLLLGLGWVRAQGWNVNVSCLDLTEEESEFESWGCLTEGK